MLRPNCTRAQVQGLKESVLTLRGDEGEIKAIFQHTQLRCIHLIGVGIRLQTTESIALLGNEVSFSDAVNVRATFHKMFS